MTIDVTAETVAIVVGPHAELAGCTEDKPSTWTLADGWPVVQKLNRERINKGRALVYGPARELVPIAK
jgi:hypothetical protein